ncbi:DUF4062 domain-containing protein [Sphingobium sp. WTD-1]|uniref:DUF4062 domain-containing protein n=1 Tax=Sphingobium sp. WTD-1 TaxID=2979467 RepID=UPI0024DE6AD0|nr:DUF4062 domain-containing protein [Sphingobium sp. WTD-1]WIA54153.1 DUF4062 domain-containing protein [Sphingobium sp. WTD-1]
MKVFVSSLITRYEPLRDAARKAITTLRNEVIMAEDFPAQPNSSQIACLQGVRAADLVVLILGPDYGFVPPGSAISATHQEYREARGTKPILAFIQQGVEAQPEQSAFIEEVQAWEGGLFRSGFRDATDLHEAITQSLHDYILSNATGPVDQEALIAKAKALIPVERHNQHSATMLELVIVGGPFQQILRPIEMENPDLGEELQQKALFGDSRLLDRTKGSVVALDGPDLLIQQEQGESIRLTEQGAVAFRLSLEDTETNDQMSGFGGMLIIEEIVRERLQSALRYGAATLERIDSTQRLTHLGIAAFVSGSEYRTWKTRAQQTSMGGSLQMGMGQVDRAPISMVIRRAALRLDRTPLIEDILVPLRRQFS